MDNNNNNDKHHQHHCVIIGNIGMYIKASNTNILKEEIDKQINEMGLHYKDILMLSSKGEEIFYDTIKLNHYKEVFMYFMKDYNDMYMKYCDSITNINNNNTNSTTTNDTDVVIENGNDVLLSQYISSFLKTFENTELKIKGKFMEIDALLDNAEYIEMFIRVITTHIKCIIKEGETLLNNIEENYLLLSNKINVLDNKYNNFIMFKQTLQTKDEIDFFEKIFIEKKIKTLKDKCIKNHMLLKSKIESKTKASKTLTKYFSDITTTTNNISTLSNLTSTHPFLQTKSTFVNLVEQYSSFTKQQLLNDLTLSQQIEANNEHNNDKHSQYIELLYQYQTLTNNNFFTNIYNSLQTTLTTLHSFYINDVYSVYNTFASTFYVNLSSFKTIISKISNYHSYIKNIKKDIYEVITLTQTICDYKLLWSEYKRRLSFLYKLKQHFDKISQEVKNENAIRNEFNSHLQDKNVKAFFTWGDLNDNFDSYGDEYYKNLHKYHISQYYIDDDIQLLKEDNKHLIEEKGKLCSQIASLKLKIKERDMRFTQFKKDIEDVNALLNDIIHKNTMNNVNLSTFEQVQFIKKTFFDYYNTLLSNKNEELNEMMLSMVNIHSVNKGNINLFIPLVKHNYNNKWYTLTMNKDINDNEYIINNIPNNNTCCMIIGEVITVSQVQDKQYEVYLKNIIYFPIKCLNS